MKLQPDEIGVIWPSAVLVMPWKEGPDFSGTTAGDDVTAHERREVQEIAESIGESDRARFYSLTQRDDALTPGETLELAGVVWSSYETPDDELPGPGAEPAPEEIVSLWQDLERMGV